MPDPSARPQVLDPALWETLQNLRFLTPAQVARRGGVQNQTIRDACNQGRLVYLGTVDENGYENRLIPEPEAEHYLATRTRGGRKGRSGRKPRTAPTDE